ncbi:MAG: HD domain-containing protein [Alphaproteobacteria bacterium]|nr:HD domain-containing protein [Alphaproteobacteria bacterium]
MAPHRNYGLRQSGISLPSLDYCAVHFERAVLMLAKLLKTRQNVDLYAVLKWAGVGVPRKYRRAVAPLIWAASRNPHSNRYHHQWHNMSVMISAALLGRQAGLGRRQMTVLVMTALVHDLDHRGRNMSRVPFGEERYSAMIAGRRLYGRSGHGQAWRELQSRLEATFFDKNTTPAIPHDDEVTQILLDADVLASCMLPRADALELTRGVMHEHGTSGKAEQALQGFIKTLAERGFAHAVTSDYAAEMTTRKAAVFIDPASAATLGFRGGADA